MSQIGADINQMRELQVTFDKQAGLIEQVRIAIDGKLNSTHWVGRKAEDFRTEWDGAFSPGLQKLVGALNDAGRHVSMVADNLERAGGGPF